MPAPVDRKHHQSRSAVKPTVNMSRTPGTALCGAVSYKKAIVLGDVLRQSAGLSDFASFAIGSLSIMVGYL